MTPHIKHAPLSRNYIREWVSLCADFPWSHIRGIHDCIDTEIAVLRVKIRGRTSDSIRATLHPMNLMNREVTRKLFRNMLWVSTSIKVDVQKRECEVIAS